jgi:hypothetical protein
MLPATRYSPRLEVLMLTILLSSTLALAGDLTYKSSGDDSGTRDTSVTALTTKGDDGSKKDCEKTNAGCVDDITTDPDEYQRLLNIMIDNLTFVDDVQHEIDVGHGGMGFNTGSVSADIFTEDLGGGNFQEHWFLNDDGFENNPGESFDIFYTEFKNKNQMLNFLDVNDFDPDQRRYVLMDIRYAKFPTSNYTAQLNMPSGTTLSRYLFEGKLNGGSELSAHLLREVFKNASGDVIDQVDHWVFKDTEGNAFELLDEPGDTLEMVATGSGTPTWFYNQHRNSPLLRGVAVTRYHFVQASAAAFFD